MRFFTTDAIDNAANDLGLLLKGQLGEGLVFAQILRDLLAVRIEGDFTR